MYYVAASGHPLFPGTVLEFHANGLSFSYTPHIMSYIMITNEIAFAHCRTTVLADCMYSKFLKYNCCKPVDS